MRRSVWFSVLITTLVLAAAGLLTGSLHGDGMAAGAGAATRSIPWSELARLILSKEALPWLGALAGLLVLAFAARRTARWLRDRRKSGRRKIVLSWQDPSIRKIARRRHMSQDAVRVMLRVDDAPERLSRDSGRSFRSTSPSFESVLQTRIQRGTRTPYGQAD
jgi:hypothetical protein